MLLCTCNNLKTKEPDKVWAHFIFLLFVCFNAVLRPVLTLLSPAAIGLRASVRRSFGILRQVVLPRPVKDIAPVLGETTYSLVFEPTHVI